MNKKIFLVFVFSILLIGSISAGLTKEYDSNTKTAKIKDGIIVKTDVADIKLNTPLDYHVPAGYQKVAEYEIYSKQDYNDVINSLELYDKNNKMNPISRNYDIKYKVNALVWVDDTEVQCNLEVINGTSQEVCSDVVIGQHQELKEMWLPLPNNNIIRDSIYTIGIFTDVEVGDRIEWIPNFFNNEIRVEEWAVWTADLNVGIRHYYKLDNNGIDSIGLQNITLGSSYGSGLINQDYQTNGSEKYDMVFDASSFYGTSRAFTQCLWINRTGAMTVNGVFWRNYAQAAPANGQNGFMTAGASTDSVYFQYGHSGGNTETTAATLTIGSYTFICATYDGTTLRTYKNAVSTDNDTTTISSTPADGYHFLTETNSGSAQANAQVDEMFFYNRSLTQAELIQIYNGGLGISYTNDFDNDPTATLNSPANNSWTNVNWFLANGTALDDQKIDNVTLTFSNGTDTLAEVNNSGVNGTYTFNVSNLIVDDGYIRWNITARDNGSQSATSESWIVNFDFTNPIINITNPTDILTQYIKDGTSTFFNWTITETNPDTCWYTYNGTNTTVTCTDLNKSIVIQNKNYNNVTFWANDSAGNVASDTQTWNFAVYENSLTYDSTISQGQTATFTLNISSDGSQSVTATLNYNGTVYSVTKTGSDSEMVFSKSLTPSSTGTIPFYWNVSYGGTYLQSATNNQTVNDLNLSNVCGVGKTVVYNFTLSSEETKSGLGTTDNATLEVSSEIYAGSTLITNHSGSSSTNSISICVQNDSLTNFIYRLDAIVKYDADPYEPEYYTIQNFSLSNASSVQNITLYDILTANSQTFDVVVRDSSYLPVSNAIVYVKRKYIADGVFRIVEAPSTDENGQTIVHLNTDDIIYTFNITKFGTVIGTFENVRPNCQNPSIDDCLIDFNAFQTSIPVPDYSTGENINFTLAYNEDTRVITSTFTILDGSTQAVSLNVTKEDALGTAVCTDILTSSSGTLTCTVPSTIGNATVMAKLYKSSTEVAKGSIKLDQDPRDIYGDDAIMFISLFVLLTIIGASISENPVYTALFLGLGIIMMFGLNLVKNTGFIGATATILYILIAIILIVIKGSKRN